MATGAQAIDVLAKVTGLSPSTVDRLARAFKQGGHGQWPRGGPGGGKNAAHVDPFHLANMAIGMACAQPITAAPEIAVELGDMACMDTVSVASGRMTELVAEWKRRIGAPWPDPSDVVLAEAAKQPFPQYPAFRAVPGAAYQHPAFRVIPGATLREALMNAIHWLSHPENQEFYSYFERLNSLTIDFVTNDKGSPYAHISYVEPRMKDGQPKFSSSYYYNLPFTLGQNVNELKSSIIQRKTTIYPGLILNMADLWADTRARTGATWPPSKPAAPHAGDDAYPESTKAGGTPLPPAPSCAGQSTGQPTGQRTAQRNSEHPIKPDLVNQRSLDLSADRTYPLNAGDADDVRRLDDSGNLARRRENHPRRAFA